MGLRSEPQMTLEEFLAFVDAAPDGQRYEAVEGRPVMMSAPDLRHQSATVKLAIALSAGLPDSLRVLTAPIDWVLREQPKLYVRQPDLVVIPADLLGQTRLTVPPLLVVEVLSPSTRRTDQVAKRREYARAGAAHYWILDTDLPALEALTLDPATGDYTTTGTAKGADALTLAHPFTVTIVPADLVT
jgi:Uma2 family endonuclease